MQFSLTYFETLSTISDLKDIDVLVKSAKMINLPQTYFPLGK